MDDPPERHSLTFLDRVTRFTWTNLFLVLCATTILVDFALIFMLAKQLPW